MGAALGLWSSSEAIDVPALLRCDGHYQLVQQSEGDAAAAAATLSTWCGWLRFDGNGCVLKESEAHVAQVHGTWEVVSAESVCVTLPSSSSPPLPRAILVREGPRVDTVLVSDGGSDGALFIFVPEEEEDH